MRHLPLCPCSFRMEASVTNEQRCTSICLSCRSCQHTPPPSGATRTSIWGLQSRSGRTGLESEVFRLCHLYVRGCARATGSGFHTVVQASVFRAEVASICPPSGATRTSIGDLQSRSGRTGQESEVSRLGLVGVDVMYAPPAVACLLLSYGSQCLQREALDKNLPFAQKLSVYAPLLVEHALVLGGLQSRNRRTGRESTVSRLYHS